MTIVDPHTPASAARPASPGRTAPVADWVRLEQLYEDPFPTFERLRAEGGVHWVPAVNRYLVTSYAAAHATELDQELFSANEEGSLMKRAMGHSMLRKDDPEHHPERRAFMPPLRPAAVQKSWMGIFRATAERYLARLQEIGPGADLVWDFAAPFAAESLRAVTGLHNVTEQDMQRWSQCLIDATGNYANDPDVWARGEKAFAEVDDAIDEMLAWHLTHPDDSLISGLLSMPGDRMPLHSIRANIKMTIGGGLNEPRDALGVASWALLSHPEQRELVSNDPSLWNAVFDESIRWVAPIGMYPRQTTRDTVLQGVHLPAGSKLGVCLLSANRDETEWPHPERFDLTRRDQGAHLAFGKGVHVCAGAWVARAEVADVALPLLFSRLPGLRLDPENPAVAGGWVFRGMDKLPVVWDPPAPSSAVGTGRHIAVVGAGPAGCYSAQALRRALPGARITVLDSRPAPFGLVRSGVAGDHQGTKAIAEQFTGMFASRDVEFVGCTRVHGGEPEHDVVFSGRPGVMGPVSRSQDADGAELTLDQLREAFDAVVLATGLHTDADPGVPGGDLPGVLGAGGVTRWLNGDPGECAGRTDSGTLLGGSTTVIGMGNVAMDVIRLLAKRATDLAGSDVHDDAHRALSTGLQTIHVLGRSAPQRAAFDPVMLREITALDGIHHVVHGVEEQELLAAARAGDTRCELVAELLRSPAPEDARLRIEWWFGHTPERVVGPDRVSAVQARAAAGGEPVRIATASVITAVGFTEGPDALLPQSALDARCRDTGRVGDGLYAAGWLRRGPRGTIASQRTDARELAQLIAADLTGSAVPGEAGTGSANEGGTPSRPGMAAVRPYLGRATDFDGWLRIDAAERERAAEGRPRLKLTDPRELRLLAAAALGVPRGCGDGSQDSGGSDDGSDGAGTAPLTILFGTESGNAELVAQSLAAHVRDRFAVTVQDLADTDPAALDTSHPYVVVCSTYGDGELPTSARAFAAAVSEGSADLSSVRYAAFGLGDRTYGETFARGVVVLDETLAAAGASRFGDVGRHDAAGGRPPARIACEWLDGIAELSRVPAPRARRGK